MKWKGKGLFKDYPLPESMFDELLDHKANVRSNYHPLTQRFKTTSRKEFQKLNEQAKLSFFNEGITFSVYSGNDQGTERIFPFDLMPRIIDGNEWQGIENGLLQRNQAINLFLKDLYTGQKILKDKIVPEDLVLSSKNLLAQVKGVVPPGEIYNHISGTDLIRHSDGDYYILEDNVRCPSGVSYVLANRNTLKKTLPDLFNQCKVQLVQEYPQRLLEMMQSVAPEGIDSPTCVVLTPGMYNSAYFDHSFLAQQMGVELVEGRDLFVENHIVYMKTIYGPERVHVIYRRVDDDFLDPDVFRKDSVLGTPGLIDSYREGNVTLINAPGTGVADDKAVYTYMPEIIQYYLQEDAILKNVETYRCGRDDDFKYVIENFHKLVVKPVDESGGYGIFMGHTLSEAELTAAKETVKANRRKYIAQPIMSLSVHPTFIDETGLFEPRHIDLRTFCLLGKDKQYVIPGGLTRVALKRGNLVVNSSQGGGSKDTWVLG